MDNRQDLQQNRGYTGKVMPHLGKSVHGKRVGGPQHTLWCRLAGHESQLPDFRLLSYCRSTAPEERLERPTISVRHSNGC